MCTGFQWLHPRNVFLGVMLLWVLSLHKVKPTRSQTKCTLLLPVRVTLVCCALSIVFMSYRITLAF